MSDPDLAEHLSGGTVDFLDFGCSKGGSLHFGMKRFGGRHGLGLDVNAAKVRQTLAAGYDAYIADVRSIGAYPDAVRFVLMSHFLEHLPGYDDAKACIEAACATAREFVFIMQPWFDADGYLFLHRLKFFWSDWQGHSNPMTTLALHRILRGIAKVKSYRLYGYKHVTNSLDSVIHSLDSPSEQAQWRKDRHPARLPVLFDAPIYQEVRCLIRLSDVLTTFGDMDALERRFPWTDRLFDSAEHTSASETL